MFFRHILVAITVLLTAIPTISLASVELDVKSFVATRHIHGITAETARPYANDRKSIETLFSILNDRAQSAAWQNAVSVLGYSSADDVAPRLISFLSNLSGELDVDAFRGALSVPLALGNLAANEKSDLAILIDLVNQEKSLSFSYQRYSGPTLTEAVARLAIQGIGFSGTDSGRQFLEKNSSVFKDDWKDNVREALTQINAKAADRGEEK